MQELKAVIVEDEKPGLINLKKKLGRNCPYVKIVGEAMDVDNAIDTIYDEKPDIVFLDIKLGNREGFEVLDRLEPMRKSMEDAFQVIFTTAYDEFTIEAIRNGAADYLLKPIDEEELVRAVNTANNNLQTRQTKETNIQQVFIPIMNGFRVIDAEEILYCKADNNRTIFYLTGNRTIKASRTLGHFEHSLEVFGFIRTHRSYLINRIHLELYSREDGGYVKLYRVKENIPVSRNNAPKIEHLFNSQQNCI